MLASFVDNLDPFVRWEVIFQEGTNESHGGNGSSSHGGNGVNGVRHGGNQPGWGRSRRGQIDQRREAVDDIYDVFDFRHSFQ
jgi:hypothetical protein